MSGEYLNKTFSLTPSPSMDEPRSARSATTGSTRDNTSDTGFPVSPYLNYDPRFLAKAQPEFIFPEGATKQRGRFELAFSQIGTSVMFGATVGGVAGFYNGLRSTAALHQKGKLRRTQMINHIMKQGSGTANTLGTIAVMYSAFGVLLQYVRGKDDDFNTVIAGTATGLFYKSTAGAKKCIIGGGIGLGVSTLYCLLQLARERSADTGVKYL